MSLSRKRSLRARENADGDLVLDAQAAEPAVRHVDLDLTAQQPLRANAKHVADDEHPDHEHRIDRGPTDLGVVRRQLRMYPRQIENRRDTAHEVIVRNHLFKAKRIEQLSLIVLQPPIMANPRRSMWCGYGISVRG